MTGRSFSGSRHLADRRMEDSSGAGPERRVSFRSRQGARPRCCATGRQAGRQPLRQWAAGGHVHSQVESSALAGSLHARGRIPAGASPWWACMAAAGPWPWPTPDKRTQ